MFWRETTPTLRSRPDRQSRIQPRLVLFGLILSAKHSGYGGSGGPFDRHALDAEPAVRE